MECSNYGSLDGEIRRGDNLAGGIIKQGKMLIWERWELRQPNLINCDLFLSSEDLASSKLVSLLLTPTFVNLN